jgi:hypothetical protein
VLFYRPRKIMLYGHEPCFTLEVGRRRACARDAERPEGAQQCVLSGDEKTVVSVSATQ